MRIRVLRGVAVAAAFLFAISVANAATLSIESPAPGGKASGSITIRGDASGYRNVEVWFNGAEIARTTPSSSGAFSVPVDTTALPNGAVTLLVNAWNSPAGTAFTLHSQASLAVMVANVVGGNQLTVTSPANGSPVAGQMTVVGTAAGFVNVELSYNGTLLARATPSAAGAFQASFSTRSIPDGEQNLTIQAWNAPAGQSTFTISREAKLTLDISNGSVNIIDFGATPDGVTDNYAPITAAIAAAQARQVSVYVPAGTFAYGNVLRLNGVKMFGVGAASTLYALNWANESIFMYDSGAEVRQLTLAGVTAPGRVAPWEATRITLFGASNFVIDHVTITGSAAAGIQTAWGANHGTISNNSVSNTLSDSIHMTDNASYIVVDSNQVSASGDDGIAVVSYVADGGLSNNITARNNRILYNLGGRSMSVVGGQNVTYENNLLEDNTQAAGLYIAQEGSWNTYGDTNVVARSNSLIDVGNASIGHGAVMIITTGSGENDGVQLLDNYIEQAGDSGIRVFGNDENIVLEGNQVIGANPSYDIEVAGVVFKPYVSGTAGWVVPVTLPIP